MEKDLTVCSTGIISHDALDIYYSQKHASIIGQCLSATWIYIFKLNAEKWSLAGLLSLDLVLKCLCVCLVCYMFGL